MGKIVFWLVVVFAILLVARLINASKARRRPPSAAPDAATPPGAMVRCVECGVFLPKGDARPVPQGFHCGQVNCAQPRGRKS
ncbi:MAG TPA: PP0621 family protein [Casimicrobiaceae bacterium]|nr:PP0621 family protein [Casimicrobiaceae bacterium]